MAKSSKYMPIFEILEENPDEYFFNGTKNEWKDMPEFIQDGFLNYDIIQIVFDSEEEVEEFGEKYLGNKDFWKEKTWNTKGMWYPEKDKKRNTNLRYVQRKTAEQYPEIYDIVSRDEIKP